jgi:hypothetical protein
VVGRDLFAAETAGEGGRGVRVLFGSGVQVAGILNGVAVGICSAGPSGRCHTLTRKTIRKQAVTERK